MALSPFNPHIFHSRAAKRVIFAEDRVFSGTTYAMIWLTPKTHDLDQSSPRSAYEMVPAIGHESGRYAG